MMRDTLGLTGLLEPVSWPCSLWLGEDTGHSKGVVKGDIVGRRGRDG